MAYAEIGDFEHAVAAADSAAGAARALGSMETAARIDARLEGFRRGEPARGPWPGQGLRIRLPPASAAALFRGYPAESPY
jgi:hypothetical protein